MLRRKPKDPERSADLPVHRIGRITSILQTHTIAKRVPIRGWEYRSARYRSAGEYAFCDPDWKPVEPGDAWGGQDATGFFRTRVRPSQFSDGHPDALYLDLDGGEALLSIDGTPVQGLDWNRRVVPLSPGQLGESYDGEHLLEIEAYIINYPYDARRKDERSDHVFRAAEAVYLNRPLEAFALDMKYATDYLSWLWEHDHDLNLERYLQTQLLRCLRKLGPVTVDQPPTASAVSDAHEALRKTVFDALFFRLPQHVTVCAHSHLDIVYLWPLKETLRKNVRTVTNTLNLMNEWPEYRFSWSQPWLYEQLQEQYPEVFAQVLQRVREGRWEPIGAMYVEPDGNLLGAESIVRQLLFGQRYFESVFGKTSPVCWLPDVFGVVHTMPQILRKAGVKYFLTVKLTIWNDTNDFPYDSFRWRSPDGSEVLAHFPSSHFGQDFSAENLRRHFDGLKDPYTTPDSLFVYGPADGGGGPTREMVHNSIRNTGCVGLPDASLGPVEAFFDAQAAGWSDLPVWDGELYLETHRGTYTSRGTLKAANRRLEAAYRSAEIVGSISRAFGGPAFQSRLNEGWKALLLNQFHDTLPGTHVPEAHSQIDETYALADAIVSEVTGDALAWCVARVPLKAPEATKNLMVFNTLSWTRPALIETLVPEGSVGVPDAFAADGQALSVQVEDGRCFVHVPDAPSLGWTQVSIRTPADGTRSGSETAAAAIAPWFTVTKDARSVETDWYSLRFDTEGRIASLYDKTAQRDVLSGPGNDLQVYEDNPGVKFSAWDIPEHAGDHAYPVVMTASWSLVESGEVFMTLASEWRVLDSVIRQKLRLFRHSALIEVSVAAEWNNSEKLLKVAFPLAVRSRTAKCHMPFGVTERSTHRNTSWEQARYEVPVHYWMDLSDAGYGVAVLNSAKYGYDVVDGTVRISLIRSPIRPDATSDHGQHEFRYALYPHSGDAATACVHRVGYEFNHPVLSAELPGPSAARSETPLLPAVFSFMQPASDRVVIEAIKQAEDGDGLILRSYEATGTVTDGAIAVHGVSVAARETDLLERPADADAAPVALQSERPYEPFEIRTHHLQTGLPSGEGSNG